MISQQLLVERSIVGSRTCLKVRGRMDRTSAPQVQEQIKALLPKEGDPVSLDLGDLQYLDSAGVAVLTETFQILRTRGHLVDLTRVSEAARRTLDLFRFQGEEADLSAGGATGFLEQLGEKALRWQTGASRMFFLIADTFYWVFVSPFSSSRGAPANEVMRQSILLGSRAFGIVSLLAFLIGLTLALLSAAQLRQFGANLYVADLVAVAMTREMGPLLTAVIVAGRSGSAIAAEIATMKVTEEVDALEVMGFSPVRFLVVPKFYAVTFSQPMLTLIADAFGILGGLVVASLVLSIPIPAFLHRAGEVMVTKDIITGLVKSVVFGWIILLVATHSGMETKGGAQEVGLSTTRSVVISIFSVIIADCAFSLLFYL